MKPDELKNLLSETEYIGWLKGNAIKIVLECVKNSPESIYNINLILDMLKKEIASETKNEGNKSNYCLSCGKEIPEGYHDCPSCAKKFFDEVS